VAQHKWGIFVAKSQALDNQHPSAI
jgi:hypothetical protein